MHRRLDNLSEQAEPLRTALAALGPKDPSPARSSIADLVAVALSRAYDCVLGSVEQHLDRRLAQIAVSAQGLANLMCA
jgi:hypothetical protein